MTYNPRRNLVTRHLDGRQVNVARVRGHLFVCANACCCGRTDLTNASVPTDLYHDEWTRRRLRNFVHLTIGGCLGPCALANVALLVFDGQSTWFHSMNDEPAVRALFEHIEGALDSGELPPFTGALANLTFTAYTWQPRRDGQELDEARAWRGRESRPDATPACELPRGAFIAVPDELSARTARPALSDERSLPRANGELVFGAAWESRAFGMAAAMIESGEYSYEAFRERLIGSVGTQEATAAPFDYYVAWLAAFEQVLADKGVITPEELDERTAEFEYGERQDVF